MYKRLYSLHEQSILIYLGLLLLLNQYAFIRSMNAFLKMFWLFESWLIEFTMNVYSVEISIWIVCFNKIIKHYVFNWLIWNFLLCFIFSWTMIHYYFVFCFWKLKLHIKNWNIKEYVKTKWICLICNIYQLHEKYL